MAFSCRLFAEDCERSGAAGPADSRAVGHYDVREFPALELG
jgi:hypothetical protein